MHYFATVLITFWCASEERVPKWVKKFLYKYYSKWTIPMNHFPEFSFEFRSVTELLYVVGIRVEYYINVWKCRVGTYTYLFLHTSITHLCKWTLQNVSLFFSKTKIKTIEHKELFKIHMTLHERSLTMFFSKH